ncbi:hypothetical protein RugamoR57_37600 [Duganella caerulea]
MRWTGTREHITMAATKYKPRVSKLIFKFCAAGIPDNLLSEFMDAAQAALFQVVEFTDDYDVLFEPDYDLEAYLPNYAQPDRSYPRGRPFELRAYYGAKLMPDLVAICGREVIGRYLELLKEREIMRSWLPGFDRAHDEIALHWIAAAGHNCNELEAEWLARQHWQPGEDYAVDEAMLERVASQTHECRAAQATWLLEQAKIHAAHRASVAGMPQWRIAEAVLGRWRQISKRLNGSYTQHAHTNPDPVSA